MVTIVGSRLVFFGDEWTFLIERHGLTAATFLAPHNEHLSAVPVLVYLVLRGTIGMSSYLPYMALVAAVNAAIGFCLFLLIKRRAGTLVALAGCVLFLLMGRGYEDVFWAFQVGWDTALLGGLVAFLLIEDPAPLTLRRQVAILLALLLCVGSSGAGLVLFALGAVSLLQRTRRRPWETWPAAIPALLYVAWYLAWGRTAVRAQVSILADLHYVVDGIGSCLLGAVGLGSELSTVAVLVAGVFSVVVITAGFRPTRRTWLGVAGLLATFALVATVRQQYGHASSSRYIYSGAIFLVFLGAEVAAWMQVRFRAQARGVRRAALGLALVVVVSDVGAGIQFFHGRHEAAILSKATIGSMQFFRGSPTMDQDITPDPAGMPGVSAPVAYALFDRYGAPLHVETFEAWQRLPGPAADTAASTLFLKAFRFSEVPAPTPGCGLPVDPRGTVLADGASMTVQAVGPVQGHVWLSITGAAPQRAARLNLAAGSAARITVPTTVRHLGWRVLLNGYVEGARRCAASP